MEPASEAEFRKFVTERSGELMRRAFVLTGGDHDLAKDLVQASLVKAVRHWPRLTDPTAYVVTCMYRQQVSWWRLGWSRHETTRPETPDSALADPAPTVDTRLAVRSALRRLTARQRAVLFLRYFEDKPEAEVAAILGCGVGTVRSTGHRALARLRQIAPELAEFDRVSGAETVRPTKEALQWRSNAWCTRPCTNGHRRR